MIEYISSYMTLHEGDMIMTGTPAGVGRVAEGDLVQGSLIQGKKELASLFMKVGRNYTE